MRRSVRVDVEEFVAARADTLLRTAYLLTGDPGRAEQLLETGLAHAWATWGHSELGPESTVRAAMVRQRDRGGRPAVGTPAGTPPGTPAGRPSTG